jgi:hypothetical protein
MQTELDAAGVEGAVVNAAKRWLVGILRTETEDRMVEDVTGYTQTFNVKDRQSGFVPGAPGLRHYLLDSYAVYLQDRWRVRPGLTFNLGLRYEYLPVVTEGDSLSLLPVIENNNPLATLLGNGKQFNYRPLSRLLEGWGISGILLWQTGRPFGIVSIRGGLNRSGYGGYVGAVSSLTLPELKKVFGFRMTPQGPSYVSPDVIALNLAIQTATKFLERT